MSPRDDVPPELTIVDPTEVRRRAIWHDVRSVLAAAATNAEYLSSCELEPDLREVVQEVEHEIRLAADVIEIVSANRDATRTLELDLRALLWVARRSGSTIVIDATTRPFAVRGPYASLVELVEALVAASASSPNARFTVEGERCSVGPADPASAESVAAKAAPLALSVTAEDGMLVLRRRR